MAPGSASTSSWVDRYDEGDVENVWLEMTRLGAAVRDGVILEAAMAVIDRTMDRVRHNVERLVRLLPERGYEFQVPSRVHLPPDDALRGAVDSLEAQHGPLPLSLRAFYDRVGLVDLRQSCEQLVRWPERERGAVEDVLWLGEFDPLVVGLIEPEPWDASRFFLAEDEFHKAGYSGGENYHVTLPEPAADFRIDGMYGIGEFFVTYLRETFRNGGFRGRVELDDEDAGSAYKVPPGMVLTEQLASHMLAV